MWHVPLKNFQYDIRNFFSDMYNVENKDNPKGLSFLFLCQIENGII